jgi:hypothetical protein
MEAPQAAVDAEAPPAAATDAQAAVHAKLLHRGTREDAEKHEAQLQLDRREACALRHAKPKKRLVRRQAAALHNTGRKKERSAARLAALAYTHGKNTPGTPPSCS